jgi:hypothetical protein
MTDRYNYLTVVLEKDMRTDDAEGLIQAIRRMRGVLTVSGNVADTNAYFAEERARRDLTEKLWHILFPNAPK